MKMVNVYSQCGVRVWYRLIFDGIEDLYPLAVGGIEEVGEPPGWFDGDISNITGVWSFSNAIEIDGIRFGQGWIQWALEYGIAPWQPFLLAVDPPEVYRCSWEYEEYEEDWAFELIARAPLPISVAAKRWATLVRRLDRRRAEVVLLIKEAREEIARDLSSMYILQDSYYPYGRTVRLCSSRQIQVKGWRHVGGSSLLEGRDDAGSLEAAMNQLISAAISKNKYLTPEIVRSLPLRR